MGGGRDLARLGASRPDLESAFADRLADSEALFEAGRFASAVVSGFYALEIRLKLRICDHLGLDALPVAFQIHDLNGLLLYTGLQRRLLDGKARRGIVKRNWDGVVESAKDLIDLRYKSGEVWSESQAKEFLDQLKHPVHGVLTWLSKQR